MKKWLIKLTKSADFWPLLMVLVVGVLASRTLLFNKGYFNMHDDLQMMRQLEMEKCFLDGQIPCRWVPDMGYGYGFPLFNFYPPLPYLVGQIFRVVQFSFVDTVKITFALSFIFSGITMYYLAKEFFNKWGGFLSAVFYIWAPYHSVDIYVRGAMNEAWALVWFPLILWLSYRLLIENKKESPLIIGLALSWTGLLLSHNLMVLIFTPVFVAWCFIWWIGKRDLKKIRSFFIAGLSAFALAAFFTLPAVVEQKYVHVETLVKGYYEFIAHYATIGQLLTSRFWGYGPSIWGPKDSMPFSVGHAHWVVSLIVLAISIWVLLKKKNKKINSALLVVFYFVAVGWFAAFMAHQNSTPIWQQIKPLSFVQFPWRFLTLVMLGMSISAGAVTILLPKKIAGFAVISLTVIVLALNWNYFLPLGGKMGPLTDEQKFAGAAWDLQRTAGIFDYLPKTAKFNPKDPPGALAEVISGKGKVTEAKQGTDWVSFTAETETDSVVRINIFEFPNWEIKVNGSTVKSFMPEGENYGRMYLPLSRGANSVYLQLKNTPVRTFSNILSLFSWVLLLTYPYWKKKLRRA
jgi:hypothetical protein